jgi:hypothetical protein
MFAAAIFGEKAEIFAWIFFCAKGLGKMSLLDNK